MSPTPDPLDHSPPLCHPTAGVCSRAKGYYEKGMFDGVRSVEDFAAKLQVPVKAIPLVVPKDTPCRSKGCPHNAINGNGDHCPCHQRTWYPLKNQRGGDLWGNEFLRSSSTGGLRTCDCNVPSCKAAGYFPGQGAIYIPSQGIEACINTPNLLAPSKKEKLHAKKGPLYLYPWHFFPEHRKKDEEGNWVLNFDKKKPQKFHDMERRAYDFPPPREVPSRYIQEEHFAGYTRPQDRWAQRNSETRMPSWILSILAVDGDGTSQSSILERTLDIVSVDTLRRQVEMWRARSMLLQEQKDELVRRHEQEKDSMKRQHEESIAQVKTDLDAANSEIADLRARLEETERRLQELQRELEELKQAKGRPIRYSDLYKGGILSKRVDAFTFFDTVEQNDAFLELINFADGSEGSFPEGDGLCQNLRPYSHVLRPERAGDVPPPLFEPDSKEHKEWLRRHKGAKMHGPTWKDDYLMFCIYVRAGATQDFTASICGVSKGRMSDIFHEWAVVLDTALAELFPRPTRSQMLRAYPRRFVETDGHARCYLLLDAFEIFTEQSSNSNVSSSTHSEYKKHCTVKFLGAVDPIGCSWAGTVPDGNTGRLSDVIATKDTKILRQVPFGHVVQGDKGFLVDNPAAYEGVDVDRPAKRRRKQVQQSDVDTGQTQKLGNKRIIVENVNGEAKLSTRYLNALIPCLQFGAISMIVRISYHMQNFKSSIIQNRDPEDSLPVVDDDEEELEVGGRPCRAEVRWYGGTDAGLVDVRGNVRLWGLQCEVERHAALSAMEEHRGKSAVEISEIVLGERWDLKKRQELYRTIHGIEYDGDL